VLYPVDVNDTAFNTVINYGPTWLPAQLDNLKTESFTYTYSRDLDKCRKSVLYALALGFSVAKRSHLIGISDPIAPWIKEWSLAHAEGAESVVLWALDQFCLIGYPVPLATGGRRTSTQG
jgi:hypothetical protein